MERGTVEIYEARAGDWASQGRRLRVRAARGFARRVADGELRVDLGCGPGDYVPYLGEPIVALDAARAMLDRVPSQARRIQGDLESLPFARGSLRGAWASKSYIHIPRVRLPAALADLHAALAPDAEIELRLFEGDEEGPFQRDDFAGRFFARWPRELLQLVTEGAGFAGQVRRLPRKPGRGLTSLIVRARRADTLPDTVGPGMQLLVCGLNPSLYATEHGIAFGRPGNRFWPAALAAGLVTRDRDPLHALRTHGLGMTDLVKRTTRKSAELDRGEYRDGAKRLKRLCAWLQPKALCFVGLEGYRAAVDPSARPGWQQDCFAETPIYLMPSTSGLNAHASLQDLSAHLREARSVPESNGK